MLTFLPIDCVAICALDYRVAQWTFEKGLFTVTFYDCGNVT